MEEGFLSIDGSKIWYSVYGREKSGTPVLAVHGGPGLSSIPDTACGLWEEQPVYFYDQLGCGKSGKAESPSDYSFNRYSSELAGVIEELRLESVILLAFSWGCALACAYMLEKKPSSVRAIVLSAPYLSTPVWNRDQRDLIGKLPEIHRNAIDEGERTGVHGHAYHEASMAYYDRHYCLLKPWPKPLMETFAALNTEAYLRLWGKSEFEVSGELATLDLVPQLRDITVPVLITCGDRDMVPVITAAEYREAFPDASLAVFPNASHYHMLEKPGLYRAAVGEFLKTIKR